MSKRMGLMGGLAAIGMGAGAATLTAYDDYKREQRLAALIRGDKKDGTEPKEKGFGDFLADAPGTKFFKGLWKGDSTAPASSPTPKIDVAKANAIPDNSPSVGSEDDVIVTPVADPVSPDKYTESTWDSIPETLKS